MTLIIKFKSGHVKVIENVDDVDHDGNELYVYLEDGHILRCKTYRIIHFKTRYTTGEEYVTFPNKKY